MKCDKFVVNAAGKRVPTLVNGMEMVPYLGLKKHRPVGKKASPFIPTCIDYPDDGDKVVSSLAEALKKCGLKDGMTIGTHHHLRDGDLVSNTIFDIAHDMGIKDLVWAPTASFPCNESIIKYLGDGTVNRIEGSMNGPLGRFTSYGGMKGCAVLRSHGGRVQAIQDGELKIDIAVIAAPTADSFGNATGSEGVSACGILGYSLADMFYAEKVIVVTDNLIPFPCMPFQIQGNYVDYVVVVDKIGIPEKIVSGTTQVTKSPDRLLLAEWTAQFCAEAGLLKDGIGIQTGAGGTSLSVGLHFHEQLKNNKWKARFGFGGSTQYLVNMLEDGVIDYILDGQAFDLEAVRSVRENRNHIDLSVLQAYNYHSKGNYTSLTDIVILGATELDTNFNGNVVTHSDGLLLHGIGGWQNCLHARNVILPIPLFRDRIPVIVDNLTTLCGPGELIDIVVTERGIAINPLRTDLIYRMKGSSLPIVTMQELKEEVDSICGKPDKPPISTKDEDVVAIVKWVDGTVLDCIYKVL
ncbi:MAG: citrate lyase subunit alpha [Bacteroidales bacterium]|jgi:citrate lyase subunit alpha/citrate CoA-transferase|nr:citrate lyase subunit alpha [Bacteroidales bacterium]